MLDFRIKKNVEIPGIGDNFIVGFNLVERMIGTNGYLKSGTLEEVYDYAGLSTEKLYQKIKNILVNF